MSAVPAIVLVTTSFPRSGDGSEAAGGFVADLADELARHGPVRVVAPGIDDGEERHSANLEVFRFAAPVQALSTLRPWHPLELLQIARVNAAGAAATRRAIARGPTAQVLALWALPSGAWARRAAAAAGLPYSVWTLGSDIWSLGRLPIVRGMLRRVLAGARHCYSDGLQLAEDTRRLAGRPVEFLPSTRRFGGVRPAPLRSRAPYRLLFLGRWHPNKGVDLLLDALALLADADWNRIEVVEICGGGPLEASVRAAAARLVAAGRPVTVRGFLDRAAAEAAMQRADWLLIPSRIESIPVVYSDAMKSGLPVIAMPVGDLRDLVLSAPACGRVADAVHAAGFAAALGAALRDDPAAYADGLRERASRFDLARIAARILDAGAGNGNG